IVRWSAVIDGAQTPDARQVAARINRLMDLGQFDHLRAKIVTDGGGNDTLPDSLRTLSRTEPPLELVNAVRAYREVGQPAGTTVWGYEDEEPHVPFKERLTGWKAQSGFWRSHGSGRPL